MLSKLVTDMTTENVGGYFGIGVTLACLLQAGKLTRQTSHRNDTNTMGQNISSSLNKMKKHTQLVSATIRVQFRQETPDLFRPEVKGDKSWRRMACEQSINRLPRLLVVIMAITKRLAHQSNTSTSKRREGRTQAEHSTLKSELPLLRVLGIHKIIPVSNKTDAWPPSRFH